ncbi:MAG: thioredoxin family protein [Planctomycetes bacterium]|nr:thioredoxin family protein [Planctomycetota bacterium]
MSTVGKVMIVAALVVAVAVVVGLKQREAPSPAPQPPPPKGALPRLVELGADKCIPCIQMAPILAELKAEYAGQFQVDSIDVWKDPGAAQEHGIQMIPTQIFFDAEGNELFRHVGFFSKEDILTTWKELGVDLSAPSQ